jgi:glutathione synthase
MLDTLKSRVEEAIDFAILHGLLKRSPQGHLVHTPFALNPCPVPPETRERLEELTLPFNRLAFSVSRRLDFLEETLRAVVDTDAFTADLLRMAKAAARNRTLRLQITRSDYFLQAAAGSALPEIRQVELNTISASYPAAAARVNRMHRHLLRESAWAASLVPNDPIPALVEGFLEAFRLYGHRDAVFLMVVQADEGNIFDQRLLEFELHESNLPVHRMTLEEIGAEGKIRAGHLTVRGQKAAITYFRAGYAPEDHRTPEALAARELIENSSTISVPDLATQLAGTKKVQQVLSDGSTLRNFCPEEDARLLQATFTGIYALEDAVETDTGTLTAWRAALAEPSRYVLKPQREGGGNNLYDEELVRRLEGSTSKERQAFILMERIRPIPHHAATVAEGKLKEGKSLSEIGHFGVLLVDGEETLINRDAGYLVRTKGHEVKEGGVSAGFGHLDSLIALPEWDELLPE